MLLLLEGSVSNVVHSEHAVLSFANWGFGCWTGNIYNAYLFHLPQYSEVGFYFSKLSNWRKLFGIKVRRGLDISDA